MSGTSLFPFLLRNVIILSRHMVPWRYKIVFDYILLNHHHLSTQLFPKLQTRIYLCITVLLHLLCVSISLILDMHESYLFQFSPGIRFVIFVFHSINTRFAGFQTVDINHFTSGTLIIYILLMGTKPQMLCALTKSKFELIWIAVRDNHKVKEEDSSISNSSNKIRVLRKRTSTISNEAFVARHVDLYLIRQRLTTKELIRKAKNIEENNQKHEPISHLYCHLFILKFCEAIFKHTMYTFGRTRTWIFIFIFLICAIDHQRIANDSNVTVFKIVFELISAFGGTGFSLGYPGIYSSFSTVLSSTSRVIIGITMILGRHRGLLDSMKDQEEIDHNADDLLKKWKEDIILQYQRSTEDEHVVINTRF